MNRKGRCGRLAVFHLVAADVPRICYEAQRNIPGRKHGAGAVRRVHQGAGRHCVCCVHAVRASGALLAGTNHHASSSAWNVSQKTPQNSRGECDYQNGDLPCLQQHVKCIGSSSDLASRSYLAIVQIIIFLTVFSI